MAIEIASRPRELAGKATGRLGIELKCQCIYEVRSAFVNRVNKDRAKLKNAKTLGGIPIVLAVVWVQTLDNGSDKVPGYTFGRNIGEDWMVRCYHGA